MSPVASSDVEAVAKENTLNGVDAKNGKSATTLTLNGDVEEASIINGTFTELRIIRNRKPASDDAEKPSEKDASEDTEKPEETAEQQREKLLKPENWQEVFSYRKETDRWGTWKSQKHSEFWLKAGSRDVETGSICLIRPFNNSQLKVVLWSKFISDLYQTATATHDFYNATAYYRAIEIEAPYAPFFHCLDKMREAVNADPNIDPLDRADFKALETLCTEGTVGNSYKNVRADLARGMVSAAEIWAAYQPDELVVVDDIGVRGVQSIMRVSSIKPRPKGLCDDDTTPRDWILSAIQISWDGNKFREELKRVTIPTFSGYKELSKLKVIPLRIHPDADKLRERALDRGLAYQKCCLEPAKALSYEGLAMPLLVNRKVALQEEVEPEQVSISGRVIVDPKALIRAAKLGNLESNSIGKTLWTSESAGDPFSWMKELFTVASGNSKGETPPDGPEFIILLPPVYPVFALEEQEWLYVNVEELKEIRWQKEAFDRLELDTMQKDLLRGLVKSHALGQDKRTKDMISGKGAGLVMLFYGPPGTGKTLTAESLGEITKRPLYKINLGLVSEHNNWEAMLDNIFVCAHAWNCILLIDEAEVVLEARTIQGRNQNNWVSVFLRKIEYFQGILILTTNIVGVIDEAFQSRISVGIEYASLTVSARLNIWKTFIEKMNPTISNKTALLKAAPEWAEEDLNARQIRNIILTTESVILGREKRSKVEPEDIQNVLTYQLEFIERVGECQKSGQKRLKPILQR